MGLEQSRRDDLESLTYTLMYLLHGCLPWYMGFSAKRQTEAATLQSKSSSSPDHLCGAYPSEFGTFLGYARALHFDSKPDYNHLHTLFHELFMQEGYQNDDVFDWCIMTTAPSDRKGSVGVKTRGRDIRENNKQPVSHRV